MRTFLFWWRIVIRWGVLMPLAWVVQLATSAIMLSWADVTFEFPSAEREADEYLNGEKPK